MIDLWIPEGALKPEAEAQLMRELTVILITAARMNSTFEPGSSTMPASFAWDDGSTRGR